jgi:diketogulonate reductase-like aldo/keto reductase
MVVPAAPKRQTRSFPLAIIVASVIVVVGTCWYVSTSFSLGGNNKASSPKGLKGHKGHEQHNNESQNDDIIELQRKKKQQILEQRNNNNVVVPPLKEKEHHEADAELPAHHELPKYVVRPKESLHDLSAQSILASNRPYILYGTAWKKDDTADLVYAAVHAGFRFIDTACQPKHYNEADVGYGWKTAADEMKLKRSDFYLQTKFTSLDGQDLRTVPYDKTAKLEAQVSQSIHASLRNLQTKYLDSLLLHSPMSTMDETLRVWKVFESAVKEGTVHNLGISNCYDVNEFMELYNKVTIKPKVLQNRFYADSNFDIELRQLCKKLGVTYQSFWTLGANRHAHSNSEWQDMARAKGLTSQTLMYAYMMTLGHTPLSGTKDDGHMKEDVAIMVRFQDGEEILNKEEMDKLSTLLGIKQHSSSAIDEE